MGRYKYLVLAVYLLVGSFDSSSGYGTKGHHSFSQSYSSSSASAHSSSFSSSGSYTNGEKSLLPIIGPIPIANSAAVASASAGSAASAVATASANAAVSGTSTVFGDNGSYAPNSVPLKDNTVSGTYHHGFKGSHGQINDENTSSKDISGGISVSGFGHTGVGSYGGSKPVSIIPTGGYSHIPENAGGYGVSGNGASISSSGSDGTYTSQSAGSSAGSFSNEKENEKNPLLRPFCCKKIAPGPDGSIYDYKVPSNVNTITATPSTIPGYSQQSGSSEKQYAQAFTSGYEKQNSGSTSYIGGNIPKNTEKKPCCKGPFPGPNGSIYDSKPASHVGTAVKQPSQGTNTPPPPLQRPQVNFPGPSGSIYTSKPSYPNPSVAGKPAGSWSQTATVPNTPGGYNSPGSSPTTSNTILGSTGGYGNTGSSFIAPNNPSNVNIASSGAGSYQINYQGAYKPSCNQGICTKEPPKTYLQPPQSQEKPIVEYVQEQPIPSIILDSQKFTIKPHIPLTTTIKPGVSGYQGSSGDSGYQVEKTQDSGIASYRPNTVIPINVHAKPQESSSIPQKPEYTPVIGGVVQVGESAIGHGGYAATSSSSGSSYSSVGHAASGGTLNTQKYDQVTVPNAAGSIPKVDEDRIIYSSGPGSYGSVGYHKPATEKGLLEGSRGSPFAYGSNTDHGTKKSDYDESKGDSTIFFTDELRGATGRGYGVISDSLSSGVGGLNVIYSGGKHIGPKPGGTYVGTSYIDSNKVVVPNQELGNGEGVIVIGTSSTDKSKGGGTSTSYVFGGGSDKPGHSDDGSRGYIRGSVGSGGRGVVVIGTTSTGSGSAGSYGYAGGSIGSKGFPCTGCGTSYRQYSNAIPSKHVAIHISSVPGAGGVSYASGGSFAGGKAGGSYGGSYGGASGNGDGGFLSSIFLGDSGVGNGGSHGKSGSYSHSGSFAKASSYASSASFSSASSGSYSSSHN